MTSYEAFLQDIGLTKSEIAVYLALLELGSATTGPIIKSAGIAAGKAYLVLDKLIQKGLVTYIVQSGIKRYHAQDPARLFDYLKQKESDLHEKEQKLTQVIPSLNALFAQRKEQPLAEVFEGAPALKKFYDSVLDQLSAGETILVMGVAREANEKLGPYLLDWQKRRAKKRIYNKLIYNHDCRSVGRLREKLPRTQVRYMKEEYETPAWVMIFRDSVATVNMHGTIISVLIKQKDMAESYKRYFDIMWKNAES